MPFTKTVKEVKRGPCGEPVEAIVKEDECEEIERLKECKFCKPLVTRPTSSVSCVFALNGRGDVLLHHIYQPRHCREKYVGRFFEWWKESTEDKTPVMRLEDVNYFWIQREAILMVGYTPRNVSSSLVLELLFALVRLFGDFIGEFSECALLRNQELVYEILTEVAEDGIPQSTDPAYLKPYIEDLPVEAPVDLPEEQELTALQAITNTAVSYTGWVGSTALSYTPLPQLAEATGIDKLLAPKTKHPHAVQPKKKALLDKRIGITHKNSQMFLDVVEEVSASWDVDTAGEMHNLKEEVLGNIFLKNYIPGVPSVEIALNNNLHVEGLDTSIPKGDAVRLKQCGFHSSVHTTEWAAFKGLNLKAPEGETKVMSYRCCGNIRHPFKLFSYVQQVSAYSYEVVLKLRSELHEGTEGKVIVQCKMLPQSAAATFRYGTVKLSSTHESQECEFSPSSCMLRWTCSVGPSTEYVVRVKVNTMTALIPPLHLTSAQLSYEVISYTSSHLAIQYVRLAKDRSFYRPEQYLRYTTKSSCSVVNFVQ
eukprot:TRINITY_DN16927_c0_g1_i1.p1 TRINITY_DN16927_c0_g1~~TRINITY_DN16927_c0_g1_i1.p1  ORF type:complete len:537 (+),score=128.87 TRINITY_DN16927_c0_g1_i1:45-1655(+)